MRKGPSTPHGRTYGNEIQQQELAANNQIIQQLPLQEHDLEPINQHLQVGIAMIPDNQWGLVHHDLLTKKRQSGCLNIWENQSYQGMDANLFIKIPQN